MEELLSRRDITIQAIKYLGLKVKGTIGSTTDDIMVRCPIHGGVYGDKNPSCGISLDKGIYHCFACGSHGSIESLFKQLTGENLYKALGIKNDPFTNFARSQEYYFPEEPAIDKLNITFTCDISTLPNAYDTKEGRDYLNKRGITEEVSKEMDIRYSDSFYINGKEYKKRIFIPIYEDKKLISIEARKVEDNDEPKVLYPKGSSVNTLYDWDNLDLEEPVYCTEGLMDMAVLRECKEFKNSTTIFGANISNRQKSFINKIKTFVYINDNDEVGENVLNILRSIQKGNIYYLRPPKELNNTIIKDIGDLPKSNYTATMLYNKKWTKYIKYLN